MVTLDNEGQVQTHGPLRAGDGADKNITAGTTLNGTLEDDDPPSDSNFTLTGTVSSAEVGDGTLITAEEVAEGHVGWSAGKQCYLLPPPSAFY